MKVNGDNEERKQSREMITLTKNSIDEKIIMNE